MNRRISKPTRMILVLACLMIATTAWGAAPPALPNSADSAVVRKSLEEKEFRAPAPMPEVTIKTAKGESIKGGAGVTFELVDVTFTGNQVIDSRTLFNKVRPWIYKKIKVSTLTEIADIITNFYIDQGYILCRAYVPPQEIKEGRVVIKVREGALGRVIVTGNQHYTKEIVKKVMSIVYDRGALKKSDLERALLLLMDYPAMTVKADLMAGERPGTTDIVVHVSESKGWGLGLDYNNFGSRYVAPHRYGIKADLFNPSGFGDEFRTNFIMGGANELYYGRAEYTFPVNHSGTRVGLSWSRSSTRPGEELRPFDYKGKSVGASVWMSYPIIRSRMLNWWVNGGVDYDSSRQKMAATSIYNDQLINARVGSEVNWIDQWYGNTSITLDITQGMKNDVIQSTSGGEGRFVKAEIGLQRYQLIETSRYDFFPYDSNLILTVHGQYSPDRLPTSQRLSIGGPGTVRGYEQGEYTGDGGGYGTLEYRLPFWKPECSFLMPVANSAVFELATFVDYGYIDVNYSDVSEIRNASIAGAGFGLRVRLNPYTMMKADWATHIAGRDPGHDGTWILQLSIFY
ncbi:MAG: ShlB/FhaC/HecB family hemolysin secretion/activation protein [Deltaproteobacteria bacterium]|nr:ShlB/FhaC/HecB family hemolysin secretion/activation protein [Deltaproteobacteria bacterium]